ncbi:hypothetical protein A2165_02390 [Candidatus Curtissbacteria bacterium RBG_13_40_7]|uniref:FCP1 homology domain-containing protein n=1 Tax=Candidatus Curtissbacteria bacterium RBG_13_40_7 TaxID=1797706 RepID=A0A1F5FUZ7_9BACT|nr:MAG: hypothetical protein A2165_02390 [Candidatus Curtissbacteria bacterium RBG_13_40_7]
MKRQTIKAVIFDLDGVILDSEPIESLTLTMLLNEYGKKPKLNKLGLMHTPGPGKGTYEMLIRKYKLDEDLDTLKKRKREIFLSFFEGKKLKPMTGFIKLVGILKKHKIKTAIASNRFVEHIPVMLKSVRAHIFFEVIVGPDEETKHKPAPDIYLKCAKELKTPPQNCVVIEDTEAGAVSGKNAGMKVIIVPNQYTKDQDFSKADKIVNSLSHITLPLIQSL